MTEIKFKPDYGYSPASPFWVVSCGDADYLNTRHATKTDAEVEASGVAARNPGKTVYVLGVISAIRTSQEILGERFDPHKTKPVEVYVDEPMVEAAPVHMSAECEDTPL